MSGGALVFECYSVWQLLGVWRIARRVRRVYVLDPAYAVDQVLGGGWDPTLCWNDSVCTTRSSVGACSFGFSPG